MVCWATHPPQDGGQGRAPVRPRGGRQDLLGRDKAQDGTDLQARPPDDPPTGRSGPRKSRVPVATERGGRARAGKGRTHSERTIAAFVLAHLDSGRPVRVTDERPACRWIGRKVPAHLHVSPSRGEYVRRDPLAATDAHTSPADAFHATLKRAVIGVWHGVSIQHPDRHLQEVAVRWTRRSMTTDARLAGLVTGPAGRLRWKALVA